jgi:three-Cys-motif partner protein
MTNNKAIRTDQPDLFSQLQPQSATKHDILAKYASAWAKIISNQPWCKDAWIVDAFAGRGEYRDGSPGSPLILHEQLARWQRIRSTARPNFRFHLRLVERNHHDALKAVVSSLNDEVDTELSDARTFREALPILRSEIGEDPALYFIDPAGWVGAEFDLVEEALRGRSKEVLINFMYDSISEWSGAARRLVEGGASDSKTVALANGLTRFFGTSGWVDIVLEDHPPREKETLLLGLYARQIRQSGAYAWPFRNTYPGKDRTYYYLIHATRNLTGLKIMKELMVREGMAPPTLFDEFDFEHYKIELRTRFAVGVAIPETTILAYTLQDTGYLGSHMVRALKDCGAERRIVTASGRRAIFWTFP